MVLLFLLFILKKTNIRNYSYDLNCSKGVYVYNNKSSLVRFLQTDQTVSDWFAWFMRRCYAIIFEWTAFYCYNLIKQFPKIEILKYYIVDILYV